MSLSPFDSFQSRFVTYLLNFPRTCWHFVHVKYRNVLYINLKVFGVATTQMVKLCHMVNNDVSPILVRQVDNKLGKVDYSFNRVLMAHKWAAILCSHHPWQRCSYNHTIILSSPTAQKRNLIQDFENGWYIMFCWPTFLYNLVNRTNLVHIFSQYVYCFSLHVSGNYVPIIRRKYRTYATPGICHSI